MKKLKGVGIISILIVLLVVLGVFTFGLIWSEFIVETDFETSGTAINKSIIWILLIFSTLLSGLIESIDFLTKPRKLMDKNSSSSFNIEMSYNIKIDFWKVFKISFRNTFQEPIFYLFTGFIVLPQFQDKDFVEPFNLNNILIMVLIIVLGMFILSVLHSLINFILNYGSGKELIFTVSNKGLFLKDKRSVRHLDWSKIKKIKESELFLSFKINRFYKIYILKRLLDKKDFEKIRKYLIK